MEVGRTVAVAPLCPIIKRVDCDVIQALKKISVVRSGMQAVTQEPTDFNSNRFGLSATNIADTTQHKPVLAQS